MLYLWMIRLQQVNWWTEPKSLYFYTVQHLVLGRVLLDDDSLPFLLIHPGTSFMDSKLSLVLVTFKITLAIYLVRYIIVMEIYHKQNIQILSASMNLILWR